MAHIFISYAPENFEYAEEVKRRLERVGFSVWVDSNNPEQVSAGKDWRQDIDEAIREAFALVAVITPQSRAFEYVTYEWTFALGVGVRVLPTMFEATPLPPRLRGLQWLDFSDPRKRPWDKLLGAVKETQSIYEFNRSSSGGPQSLQPLIAAMSSSNPDDLRKAFADITHMNDWTAREALVTIMRHPAQNMRTAAALALARAGDARATTTLMDALLRGSLDVQTAALRALMDINPERMLELVLKTLSNDEQRVKFTSDLIEVAIPRHVFISYSRRDEAMMVRLRDDMQDERLIVWTDEALTPGDPSWQMAIESAIENAGCVVVVLSPEAKKSEWVRAELQYAHMHKVTIFPLLARGDEATAVPLSLTGAQFLDVRNEAKYASGVPKLIAHLQRYLRRLGAGSVQNAIE